MNRSDIVMQSRFVLAPLLLVTLGCGGDQGVSVEDAAPTDRSPFAFLTIHARFHSKIHRKNTGFHQKTTFGPNYPKWEQSTAYNNHFSFIKEGKFDNMAVGGLHMACNLETVF